MTAMPTRVLIADRGDEGIRLDLVLRRHLTDLSRATRTRVQAWIETGPRHGERRGRSAACRARAALGDAIALDPAR